MNAELIQENVKSIDKRDRMMQVVTFDRSCHILSCHGESCCGSLKTGDLVAIKNIL